MSFNSPSCAENKLSLFQEKGDSDADVHRKVQVRGICCCCSVAQSCPTLCDPTDCSMLGFPVLHHLLDWNLLRLMSIESVMPSNYLILYCPLLLLSSIFPSIRVFFNKSALSTR